MSYIVESTASIGTGSSALTISIGTPIANDLILIFAAGTGATLSTPSGYTQVYSTSNTVRQYCWYKVAGVSESNPTTTPGYSTNAAFVAVIVRDADTTTPITLTSGVGYNTSTFTNVKEVTAPTLTTGSGKAQNLVLHAGNIATDSIVAAFASTSAVSYAENSGRLFVAKEWVEAASTASTAFTWLTNQSTSRTGCLGVVSINNKSGGLRDISCLMTHTRLAKPYPYGTNDTLSAPNTILSTLDSLAVASAAAAVSGGGTLSASYLTALNIATNTNFGADTWAGFAWPAAVNMSGKVVGFAWNPTQPWSTVTTHTDGIAVLFTDGTKWAAYQVRPLSRAYLNTDMIDFISPGATTPFATSETPSTIDWTAITAMGWVYARKGSQTNTPVVNLAAAFLFNGNSTLVGGSATKPITASQIYKHITQYIEATGTVGLYPFAAFQGSGQYLAYTPFQLGDGSTPTYVRLAKNSCETPPVATRLTDYSVAAGAFGITLYGSASDTFDFSPAVLSAATRQYFTIHAFSSTSATYNFSGCSFIGYDVTWKTGVPCVSATFSGCYDVDMKGANLTNCTITNPQSTAGLKITEDGSVLDGCTIDVTGTSAGYHLELGASVTAVTLTDVTLTGTPGTDKVHVLATTGTVTITISGTTSLVAGDVTSAGATVVIAAPELYQSVAITGLAPTYRLQIFDIEYDLTVSGITVTPTAGATYTHNGITWTVRSASIVAGAGTVTVYGTGTPAASGTLTKTGGTGDASVIFSAYAVDGTELYIGVPGATSYTWTDTVAAAAPRVIRVRVMEDGPGTSDAIEMIDAIVGMCGITDGTEAVGYLVAAVADDVYNDRGVDGSAITGITIDDTTLRLEIASGTITNYNGTDVLVVDGRDLYAYETYWLGTTAGMRDEARFIEAIDAVNFRCSNFKLKGTSGYPIMINNCFIVDAATGIFSSMVDYSGDPISNHPEHMKAIVVTTSDSVVTGTLSEFIAAVPTASDNANAVWAKTLP